MGLFSRNASGGAASTNSASITEAAVLDSLRTVIDPDLRKDVVSLGMIRNIAIEPASDGARMKINFTFQLTTPSCPMKDRLESEARAAVASVAPEAEISINMTANVSTHNVHGSGPQSEVLPGVRNTIAVASGKGGVGKSTVAANLALALARDGARVGLLDADIYGPSIPIMFGVEGEKPQAQKVGDVVKMIPIKAHGIKVMSIGFMVAPNTAVVWRGPMASGALKQFITDAYWGELDYLIFDLPPGTGDIQLTLVQTLPLTGAVIVTTPQDVALADARKGVQMFEKVNVPILGLVENMSYFECSHCGTRENIFDNGGGERAAAEYGVPFLGALPLETIVRKAGDAGMPVVASNPDSAAAKSIMEIASKLAQQVSILNLSPEQQPVQISI